MKKKLITLILTMTMGLSVVACAQTESTGSNNNDSEVSSEAESFETISEDNGSNETEGNEEGGATVIDADDNMLETTVENPNEGIGFSILDDGKTVLEKLGDPASETESGDYFTNTYYSSAEVTYSKDGDKVEIIEFKSYSDAWKTSKGITIGSTFDEIITAYGDPSDESEEGELCLNYFYEDGYSISFTLNDNNEVTYFAMVLGRG